MVSIGELDENGRLKPTKQDNGDLTWVAACETCATRVHASVNGAMTEAAARVHAKAYNHTVIMGMEFAGSLLGDPKPFITPAALVADTSAEDRARIKKEVAEKMEDVYDAVRILRIRCHWDFDAIGRALDLDERDILKALGLSTEKLDLDDFEVEQKAVVADRERTGERREW